MTIIHSTKNQKILRALAKVLFLSLFLYTLNFEGPGLTGLRSDALSQEAPYAETGALSASSETALRPVKAFHEPVLAEGGKAEVKPPVLKQSGSGKQPGARKQAETALLLSLSAAAVLCVFLVFYFFQAAPDRHLSVISYIHDSDGMKP